MVSGVSVFLEVGFVAVGIVFLFYRALRYSGAHFANFMVNGIDGALWKYTEQRWCRARESEFS